MKTENIFNKFQKLIVPNLKNSLYLYEPVLNSYVDSETQWLDLGCGHQIFPRWFEMAEEKEKHLVSKCKAIIGFDYNFTALKNNKNIRLKIRGLINSLPFQENTFDLITANMVVEHLKEPNVAFKEINRVLKPGGIVIIHTTSIYSYLSLLGKLAPKPFKKSLIHYIDGRKDNDIFETHFKANNNVVIRNLAEQNGFKLVKIKMVATSAQLKKFFPFFIFELIWLRLSLADTLKYLRTNIIAILRKTPTNCFRTLEQTSLKENVNEIVAEYAELISDRFPDKIEAIILSGSFSRNEGVYFKKGKQISLLSDLEFLVIFKPTSLRILNGLKITLDKCISSLNHGIKVSIGCSTLNHLAKLKPWIYTVEIKKFGKVVYGNKKILDYIPDYTYDDIEPPDGFLLLNNRIVEQLILLNKIKQGQVIYRYEFFKGYIQIANSLLAFHKKYRSLYSEKKNELLKLFSNIEYLKQKCPDLISNVENSFNSLQDLKLQTMPQDEAMREWKRLRENFKMIWQYESCILTRSNSEDIKENIRKFISVPNFEERIKGWIKVFLKKKIYFFRLKYIFITSPQFLIYQKAISAYLNGLTDKNSNLSIIKEWEEIVK